MKFDAVEREIFKSLFVSVAEEMGTVLQRASFSPNIKERRDYSCAVFDGRGDLVAQGDHMPVHLGSMPASVASALAHSPPDEGDVIALNDPFEGGTHLPDVTLVSPVVLPAAGRPRSRRGAGARSGDRRARARGERFYLATRAHHADVGGSSPGSMPLSTEIYQEGLRIPPVRLVRRGERVGEIWRLLLANVRTPLEREGDLAAQLSAHHTGERRLRELAARHGAATLAAAAVDLQEYTERVARAVLRSVPNGTYPFEDHLDDDGAGSGPVPIRVKLVFRGDRLTVNFHGSFRQVKGPLNAVAAVTISAVAYVIRCLLPPGVPANAGGLRPVRVLLPERSIVNASPPAAVAGGNVETSQRIVDVLLGALARARPDLAPAASGGTMNNVTFGGLDPRTGEPFAYYETLACGAGAAPGGAGAHGVHTHMTNSRNSPVEALENEMPVRLRAYHLRRRSGGSGRHRGGDGLRREYEFLVPVSAGILADRRVTRPYGLSGGGPGRPGRDTLVRSGRGRRLPAKVRLELDPGDRLRIETPGGGGFGRVERGGRLRRKKASREQRKTSQPRRRRRT
jgi:N-methylhydantoinase B